MPYTTIQIKRETRHNLERLKENSRETYDQLLNKLLALVPSGDEEGQYTEEFRISLLNAKLDLRKGKTIPHERAKRILGL